MHLLMLADIMICVEVREMYDIDYGLWKCS